MQGAYVELDGTHGASGLVGQPLLLGEAYGRVRACRPMALADWAAIEGPAQGRMYGAFPFDSAQAGYLYRVTPLKTPRLLTASSAKGLTLTRQPAPEVYGAEVARVAARIAAGELDKAVLARALIYETDAQIDPVQVALRLSADRHITPYCFPLGGAVPRLLVGATPELLLAKDGAQVRSNPLAGSIRRRRHAAEDGAAAEALLASEKDAIEHRVLVDYIHDILAPYCRALDVPKRPVLNATATLWHLGTSIRGTLKDPDTPCLDLLNALHPTPAVAGYPLNAALAEIAASEPFDRGFYAGTLGWVNGANNGVWHVTLRCAIIKGAQAQMFAGAGIVASSDPEQEIAETRAKFAAMREALGIDTTF